MKAAEAETVTAFTRRLKGFLEQGMGAAWVRGEVSNFRPQPSGHLYFSLKDSGAQVRAVLFRMDAMRNPVALKDGVQIIVHGEVSVYEARGEYQLIVREVVDDGVGRLQREFEALKRRLAAEGLFAPEKKRALPRLPVTVGFITSPSGAAVQDFIRILRRRAWRGRVIVLPARVQGAGAAEEIAGMIRWAGAAGLFDLLVVGRGGGSIEDLWSFNEEVLVRAVAASPVPVISAVGHEIDFTLCDFAADIRAETPSAAAELISSHFVAAGERAGRARERLSALADEALRHARRRLEHAQAKLRLLSPAAQVERGWLRLDDLANRKLSALCDGVHRARRRFEDTRARFDRAAPERRLELHRHRIEALGKRLESANPRSVLNRGYVFLRDGAGIPITRRGELRPGQAVRAEFADGSATLRAE
jgi:exodeoxyribonuclease VII large subunit